MGRVLISKALLTPRTLRVSLPIVGSPLPISQDCGGFRARDPQVASLQGAGHADARPDFARHRLFWSMPDRGGRAPAAGTRAGQLPAQRAAAEDPATPSWSSTAATANGLRRWSREGRKQASLKPLRQAPAADAAPDLHYLFAPLKHARLDYMAQKAVEMGAGVLQPVLTRRTQVSRLNLDRLRANAVEAAEQCGILSLPEIRPERPLEAASPRSSRSGCWSSATRRWSRRSPVAALAAAPAAARSRC